MLLTLSPSASTRSTSSARLETFVISGCQSAAVSGMDGRVILEALANGPDEEQVAADTRSWRVQNGSYSAVLQTSESAGKRYIDKAWREK